MTAPRQPHVDKTSSHVKNPPAAPTHAAMVQVTLNDKLIQVPAGTRLIQAALDNGVFIPHYCYHQDLSIAGVCRMCFVEIEKNPRLQISCNTVVADGMVVKTNTERVRDTVKRVLELHLINHPLDCPICDKAGECKLQDFYRDYGLYVSRMPFEKKVNKPKVVDIGTIVLDEERCILCTRCVRFTAEVTQTHELGIFNRGDRSALRTYDGEPLRNDYTGNLADICPVGALTAKDFRFRQRVWFMDKTPTFCTLCARGCNTEASVRKQTSHLYRIEPRRNPEINMSWMCDEGRWGYHHLEGEMRLLVPKARVGEVWQEETWHSAFRQLRAAIEANPSGVLVGLSAHLTNEEVADAVLALVGLGVENFVRIADEAHVGIREAEDGILRHADKTPNAQGVEEVCKVLGVRLFSWGDLRIGKEPFSTVLLLGLETAQAPGLDKFWKAVHGAKLVVVHATTDHAQFAEAHWVLPNTTSFEKTGSMINALGYLQKLNALVPLQGLARTAHHVAWGLQNASDKIPLPRQREKEVFVAVMQHRFPALAAVEFHEPFSVAWNAAGEEARQVGGGKHA